MIRKLPVFVWGMIHLMFLIVSIIFLINSQITVGLIWLLGAVTWGCLAVAARVSNKLIRISVEVISEDKEKALSRENRQFALDILRATCFHNEYILINSSFRIAYVDSTQDEVIVTYEGYGFVPLFHGDHDQDQITISVTDTQEED